MLSYNHVAQAIEDEGRRIGRLAEEIAVIATKAAEEEANHRIDYAKIRMTYRDQAAKMNMKVTVDMVDDWAIIETSDTYRSSLIATAALTAARDAMRASQARLDGLRTLATGYRLAGG